MQMTSTIAVTILAIVTSTLIQSPKPPTKGISLIMAYGQLSPTDKEWSQPFLTSVKMMKYWSQLEPKEGEFDTKSIDDYIKLAASKKKTVILSLVTADELRGSPLPAQATPEWVFRKGARAHSMTNADGKTTKVPVYWDPKYLEAMEQTVKELARRYDGKISRIEIGSGIYGETLVGLDILYGVSGGKERWLAEGLSKQVWMDTNRRLVKMYKTYFKKTQVSLLITDTGLMAIGNYDRLQLGKELAALANDNKAAIQYCGGWAEPLPYGSWPYELFDFYKGKGATLIWEARSGSKGFTGNFCDPKETDQDTFEGFVEAIKTHGAKSATFWCNDIRKAAQDPNWSKELASLADYLKTQK